MKKLKLVICDSDELYCRRLDEYLRSHLHLGFEIFSFTDFKIMEEFARKNTVELLMIAESMLEELGGCKLFSSLRNILILDEGLGGSSVVRDGDELTTKYVDKYQSASSIVDNIIGFCMEDSSNLHGLSLQTASGKGRVISLYSPLSKCGQTTLAVNIAELLAKESKTIFLSFESFSTLPDYLGIEYEEDISDLVYYADCERDKFVLYLEKIKRSKNNVDYIMPAKTAMQIKEIGFEKVMDLYRLLTDECGYDNIVVDLTELPGDFFDIASSSEKIFTITRDNLRDNRVVQMYDEVLRKSELEDIIEKTIKCQLPDIRDKQEYDGYVYNLLAREGLLNGR